MYSKVLLLLQLTLLTYSQPCQNDDDCPSYMGCDNNQCALCDKLSSRCGDSGSWPCCGNNTCQNILSLNSSMCFPEWCVQDSDCGGGFGCKIQTGKCDLCYKNDDMCIGKILECCNGRCDPVSGTCQKNISTKSINLVDVDNINSTCTTSEDCSQGFGCLFRLGKCGLCYSIGERCTLPYDSLECCSSYCRIGVNIDGSGVCADPRHFQPTQRSVHISTIMTIPPTPSMWNERLVALMLPHMTNKSCVTHFDCGINQDCLSKHNKCVTCQRYNTDCSDDSDCCSKNCYKRYNTSKCGLHTY